MKRVWGETWFGVTGVAYSAATGLGNNAVCVFLMTTDGLGRWFYHGHNGDRGKVKGLKDNLPFAYGEFRAGE